MSKQVVVYNPITLKKHTFSFNELRLWMDVKTLQRLVVNNLRHKSEFDSLPPEQRENFLRFIDKHDDIEIFKVNPWKDIPGLKLTFELKVRYDENARIFYDSVNKVIHDNFFYKKKIFTFAQEEMIIVNNAAFPINVVYALSEDFHFEQPLKEDEKLPVFDFYSGSDSEEDKRIMLNQNSIITPVTFNFPIYSESCWVYELHFTVENVFDDKYLLWNNIPRIKKVYNFFYNEGFTVKGDGIKQVIWEREGDIIEYNQTPSMYHLPFVIVKQHDYKTDVYSRSKLGKEILEKMECSGLLEEINLYKGNALVAQALDTLNTKNKKQSDTLLIEAMDYYNRCQGHLWGIAKIETIFCDWLKTRIANYYGDKEYKFNAYRDILHHYIEMRTWDELVWFLGILKQDKEFPFDAIKDVLPLMPIDKNFMIRPDTYKALLDYWDEALRKENCPNHLSLSEWHYIRSKEAYEVGMTDFAARRLKLFFIETEKDPSKSKWAEQGTEELLDFAMRVDCSPQYLRFAKSMASYFAEVRRNQSIGDMSAIGRKNYRWALFRWCIAESRWAFHAGFLLSKSKKPNQEEIRAWYNQSYEAFAEAMLYYDITEHYDMEQVKVIAHGFVTIYNAAFSLKDYEMMDYALDLLRDLWSMYYSTELYSIIHGIFIKEERIQMADFLIESWMKQSSDEKGNLKLDKEKIIDLAKLYISVEEWGDAASAIEYGLNNFDWNYYSLNSLYELYVILQEHYPKVVDICEEMLYNWINAYIEETLNILSEMPNLRYRIRKIQKV